MKNTIKKIGVLLVAVIMLFASTVQTKASTYVGQISVKEGGFWIFGRTTYTYKLYYEGNINIAVIAPNMLLTDSNHHTYGKTPKTLNGQVENAYSYSTTVEFNNSTGASVGVSKLVSLSAEKGYGITTGFSYSKAYIKGVSFTPDRYDKTGYYVIAGGATCKKMTWQKYLGSDKLDSKKGTFYMPYGPKVTYTMYSTDNASWKFY